MSDNLDIKVGRCYETGEGKVLIVTDITRGDGLGAYPIRALVVFEPPDIESSNLLESETFTDSGCWHVGSVWPERDLVRELDEDEVDALPGIQLLRRLTGYYELLSDARNNRVRDRMLGN